MVTHFSVATGEVACGRNNHYVSGTRDKLRVSCRNCRSTEVFKTHSDAQADSGGGTSGATYKWRHAWAVAVQTRRPHDRLPRGIKPVVLPVLQ